MAVVTTSNHVACLLFLAALMIPGIGKSDGKLAPTSSVLFSNGNIAKKQYWNCEINNYTVSVISVNVVPGISGHKEKIRDALKKTVVSTNGDHPIVFRESKTLFHFVIIRIKNYVDFLTLQPALRAVCKDLLVWRKVGLMPYKEGHPSSQVNFNVRLYDKNIVPLLDSSSQQPALVHALIATFWKEMKGLLK